MLVIPNVEEVVSVAESLGIHLGSEEAVLYQEHLVEQLRRQDAFLQLRIEEAPPPRADGPRGPGYRPSDEEDPFRAWLWKCRIEGDPEGLLSGKTVSFKDHIAVAGIPLTFGSYAMEGFIADFDATVVRRVLAEGGTVIGKNTTDWTIGGFGLGGGIADYWQTKNPHNTDHLTGGSSSGSAVAVAIADVDISFGGDQGGSIRIPAAWSGAIGLKPTFGLISHFGASFGADQSLDHIGPIARTSEDVAKALQAVAGFDDLDPRQGRDVPIQMDVLTRLKDGISGLRVAVVAEGFEGAESDVSEIVLSGIDVLEAAGAHVSEVSIPEHSEVSVSAGALMAEGSKALFDTGVCGSFTKTYYPGSLIATINKMWATEADSLGPLIKFRYLLAEFSKRSYHGRVYAKAQNVRPTYVKAYDAALADVDILIMPTCIMKAPRSERRDDLLDDLEANFALLASPFTRNTRPFSYTGHPALAVPCGKSEGLPVSMQLIGRHFEDPLLLRFAYAYEHSVAWQDIIAIEG